ncbi:hypothetical protein BDY24DRAFT_265090 [Mrakia frigida]|uniref:uncharacterized protein n=1 Tax=Mrakia frigida TaxID=29902 RepID=UPI003FCC08BC
MDQRPGVGLEVAALAGDRLIVGFARYKAKALATDPSVQIGWVDLRDTNPQAVPRHRLLSELGHSAETGVSSLCGLPSSLQPDAPNTTLFASGGIDHSVTFWKILETELVWKEKLHSSHKSRVDALAFCPTKGLLWSGGGSTVVAYDMRGERIALQVAVPKFDVSVCHLHLHTSDPNVLLLEVRASKRFRLFDARQQIRLVDFGVEETNVEGTGAGTTTTKFQKASFLENNVASGDRKGILRIWDVRNLSKPTQQIKLYPDGHEIRQVILDGDSRLLDLTKWGFSVRDYTRS